MSDNIDIPQTIARLFSYRRGHSTPDFFLIVPENHHIYRSKSSNSVERLGIASFVTTEDNTIKRWFKLVSKSSL